MLERKPPFSINKHQDKISIFLAGTIDMGNSEDWQTKIANRYKDKDLVFYNPRRDSWDSSWEQTIENPQFYQQVNWELNALDKCDIIILNFLETSQSPISLLELGLYANTKKIFVCCPDKFYRSGNVQVVCDRIGIPIFQNIEELLTFIEKVYEI
jgi:hypothetical protein